MRNILGGFAVFLLAACSAVSVAASVATNSDQNGWIDRNKNGAMDPYENPNLAVDERVADLIGRMSLDEKTCQMVTLYGYKRVLKDPRPTAAWKTSTWKDGVANFDEHANGIRNSDFEDPAEHAALLNEIQRWFIEETRLGIPVDFTNEGIRGICHPHASNFPSQLAIGATFDRALVRRIGEITGEEAKALGYTNIYSPILDTVRDPRWGRTIECYGESPFLVGELGKQQTLGLQSQGVASTVKHFAAYSNPNGGRDGQGRTDPQIPFRDMHEILMHPFQKVIAEASPKGAMSSYNTYDGVPVTGSSYFLQDLLRDEYGFKGYVVSDSGAVFRLLTQHKVANDFKEAVAQAVNSGLNVRTTFVPMEAYVRPLRQLVHEGRISEETINSRVADVLRVKFEIGLFDAPFVDEHAARAIVRSAEHEAVTLEAARKSVVLLKNENSLLPLNMDEIKTLLVTGPGADTEQPMLSRYGPKRADVVTPLAGIKECVGDDVKVLYARGAAFKDERFPESDLMPEAPRKKEKAELDRAIELSNRADAIVVVLGDDHLTVGESHSRTSLNLAGHQRLLAQEMMKSGKPVIVVLMSGRAASINWIDKYVPAIFACWHGGDKVGQAVAETLFGEINPGGKLPITFPRTAGQIPMCIPHRNGAWGGQHKAPDENGFGATRAVDPLYYFGEGLSYTTFEYSNIEVTPAKATADEPITITCEITNSGQRAGDEVVQLYTKDLFASVTPFDQLLRGFERVSLQPGETKQVSFTIQPKRDLKMLNRANEWVVEPGDFEARIGTSSAPQGIQLKKTFAIGE